MQIQKKIWSEIIAKNQNSKLSSILSIYDLVISQYKVDPASEIALRIYQNIIKYYRDGKFNQKKTNSANMFSFGKQNSSGIANNVDSVKTVLKFEDTKEKIPINRKKEKSPPKKSIKVSKSQDIQQSESKQHLAKIQQIKKIRIKNLKQLFIKALETKHKRTLLTQILKNNKKQSLFSKMKIHIKQNKADIKNLKNASANYLYNQTLTKKYFEYFKKITQQTNQFNENVIRTFNQNYNTTLNRYFTEWKHYFNRLEDERKNEQIRSQNKKTLRKIRFFKMLKKFHQNNLQNLNLQQKKLSLSKLVFLIHLQNNIILEKNKTLFKCKIKELEERILKRSFIKKFARKILKLNILSKILQKNLVLRRSHLFIQQIRNYQQNQIFLFQRFLPKLKFIYLITTTLNNINIRDGIQYQWMKQMNIFTQNYKIQKYLSNNLMIRAFRQLKQRLRQQKNNIIAIKSIIKMKYLKSLMNFKNKKQIQQTNQQKIRVLIKIIKQEQKSQLFKKLYLHHREIAYISKIRSNLIISSKRYLFKKYLTQRNSTRYVYHQYKQHLQKQQLKTLRNIFEAMKSILLQRILSKRIIQILCIRRYKKKLKQIFNGIKDYAFQKRILNLKCQNLKLLRRQEYADVLIDNLKFHYRKVIHEQQEEQIIYLFKVETKIRRIFEFLKLKTMRSHSKVYLEQVVEKTYSFNTLKKVFQTLRIRKFQKQQSRGMDEQITEIILKNRKKRLFNQMVNKTIISIELRQMSSILIRYLLRKTWTQLSESYLT